METRRAKRRRKAVDVPEPLSSNQRSYLDSVPYDALSVVVRHLSTRPHLKRWQAYVAPHDALQVLQVGGTMTEVARASFRVLHVHFDYAQQRGRAATGVQMERAADGSVFADLVAEQGPRLHTLTLDVHSLLRFSDGSMFEYCLALHALVLGFNNRRLLLAPVFAACGGTLKELRIECEETLDAVTVDLIAKHCRVLEFLAFTHKDAAPLDKLWKAIGGTLRRLAFAPPRVPGARAATLLLPIATHCIHLKDIELLRADRRVAAEALFSAMGSRIQVLRFMESKSCPAAADLARMLTACPLAAVHAYVQQEKLDTLRVLGARLRTLRLRHNFNHGPGFSAIAATFTGVEELNLEIRATSASFLESLFATAKPNLRKFTINRVYLNQKQNVLNIIAKSTHSVRDLTCTTKEALDARSCHAFFTANTQLRRLRVWNNLLGGSKKEVRADAELKAAGLVRRLYDLPHINEVVIHDMQRKGISTSIADACVPLRGRRLDIIIGDVQYMPLTVLKRKYIQY